MKPTEASAESISSLGLGYAVTLLTVWMLMILCLTFYRISRADHEQNLRDLAGGHSTGKPEDVFS